MSIVAIDTEVWYIVVITAYSYIPGTIPVQGGVEVVLKARTVLADAIEGDVSTDSCVNHAQGLFGAPAIVLKGPKYT